MATKQHLRKWSVLTVTLALTVTAGQVFSQADQLYGFDPQTRIYIVQPGDTMWGIADKAYQDPWKWPRVWENNPAVENPHVIYPDGQLVLPYTDGMAPVQQVAAEPEPVTEAIAETPVTEAEPEVVEVAEPEPAVEQDGADILKDYTDEASQSRLEVQTSTRLVGVAERKMVLRLGSEGMLISEENRVKVSLMGDDSKRTIFAKGDRVYLSKGENAGIQKGTRYYTYSKFERLQHPSTRKDLGLLIRLTGVLEVVDVSKKSSTAVVRENFDIIDKSQFLMEYVDKPKLIVPQYAASQQQGVIVRANDALQVVAAHQVVYVDLGREQGLENGTMLNIYRDLGDRYDRIHKEYAELPQLDLGLGVVLDAGERSSTVLIVKSRQEIRPGDQVGTLLEGI